MTIKLHSYSILIALTILLALIFAANGLTQGELTALGAIKRAWPMLAAQHPSWQAPEASACNTDSAYFGVSCSNGSDPHIIGLYALLFSSPRFNLPFPAYSNPIGEFVCRSLSECNLNTSIPEEMKLLEFLESLDLSYNALNDDVPGWLGSMKKLTSIDLEGNAMKFGLFSNGLDLFCQLQDLKSLRLVGLLYSSPAPCWFELVHLEELSIGSTSVPMFNIPDDILYAPALRRLAVSDCLAINAFPFEKMVNLTHLRISDIPFILHATNASDLDEIREAYTPSNEHSTATFPYEKLANFPRFGASSYPVPVAPLPAFNSTTLQELVISNTGYYTSNFDKRIHIPESIYSCLNLEHLDLSENLIVSTISPKIQQLQRLKVLDLSGNGIYGRLPDVFAAFTSMEELRLSGGILSSTIPRSIWQLPSLQILDISGQFLTGTISEAIGSMKALQEIDLSGLLLSGTVPASITNLVNLRSLDLQGNGAYYDALVSYLCYGDPPNPKVTSGLYGPIFDKISGLPNLEFLSLSGNLFNGTIPSMLPPKLEALDLHDNFFYGTIPASLGSAPTLAYLDLSNNLLQGSIPASLSSLTALRLLDLHSNFLNATLPSSLSLLSSLTYLDISNTRGTLTIQCAPKPYSGPSAATWALNSDVSLGFQNNTNAHFSSLPEDSIFATEPSPAGRTLAFGPFPGVSGSIPPSFGKLSSLRTLILSNNALIGTIPDSIYTLTNLTRLKLGGNGLSGFAFPSALAALTKLTELHLSSNYLEGSISATVLSALTKLEVLSAYSLELEGEIPDALLSLTSLTSLDLHDNFLSEKLPGDWSALSRLSFLDLSQNKLKESLPMLPPSLQFLFLEQNQFSGGIPSWSTPQLKRIDMYENKLTGTIPAALFANAEPEESWLCKPKAGCPPDSICAWREARCENPSDELWRVVCIAYRGLSPALCNPALQYVDLSNNRLTGSVPPGLVNMTGLDTLDLVNNRHLQGRILDYLVNASNLRNLLLGDNEFTGTFPDHLYHKYRLVILDLSSNLFEGPINASIGRGSALGFINLADNSFTGRPLESDICFALGESLATLVLAGNSFEGELPICDKVKALRYLDISQNEFSGTIPRDFLKFLPNILTSLRLHGNAFTGSLPDTLYDITSLNYLTLNSNRLGSSISARISKLSNLRTLDLRFNQFRGSIPDSIANLTQLRNVLFGNNQFSGTLPAGLRPIGPDCDFDVVNNLLRGVVPDLSTLNCVRFFLDNNYFSGSIPRVPLGARYVGFSSNIFSGTIDHFHLLSNRNVPIEAIRLSSNKLEGTMPAHIWALVPITTDFQIQLNKFVGTLPALGRPLETVSPFQEATLYGNFFNGSLPAVSYPLHHTKLDFSDNMFTGSIPPSYRRNLPNLQHLDFSDNLLGGDLANAPPSVTTLIATSNRMSFDFRTVSLPSVDYLDLTDNKVYGTWACTGLPSMRMLAMKYNSFNGTLEPNDFGTLLDSSPGAVVLFLPWLEFTPWTTLPSNCYMLSSSEPLDQTMECLDVVFATRMSKYLMTDSPKFLSYINCVCQDQYYGIAPTCFPCPKGATSCHNRTITGPSYHFASTVAPSPPSGTDHGKGSWCNHTVCFEPCYVDPLDGKSNCLSSTLTISNDCSELPTSPCTPGSTGRACSKCQCSDPTNCYFLLGGVCERCPPNLAHGAVPLLLGFILIPLLIVALAALACLSTASRANQPRNKTTKPSLFDRVILRCRYTFPSSMAIILINFWQMISMIAPDSMARFALLRVLNGRFGATKVFCVAPHLFSSPLAVVLLQLLSPFSLALSATGGVLLSAGIHRLLRRFSTPAPSEDSRNLLAQSDYESSSEMDRDQAEPAETSFVTIYEQSGEKTEFRRLLVSWPLNILRIFYQGIAITAFEYLPTETSHCSQKSYIVSHPWMEISEAKPLRWVSVPFIIYLLALPVALLVVTIIWRRKHKDQPAPPLIEFPVSLYRSAIPWWETTLFARKFAMAFIFRFVGLHSALRPGFLAIITTGFMVAQLAVRPWKSKWANVVEAVCLCLLNFNIVANYAGYLQKSRSSTLIYTSVACNLVISAFIIVSIIYRTVNSRKPSSTSRVEEKSVFPRRQAFGL